MKKNGNKSSSNAANEIQANDPNPLRRSSRSLVSKFEPELVKSRSESKSVKSSVARNKRKSAAAHSTVEEDSSKRTVANHNGSINKRIKTTKHAANDVNQVDHKDSDEASNDDTGDNEFRIASDDDACGDDESKDDDKAYADHRQKRRRTKSLTSSEGPWECPHCNKKFGSSLGLQYHVDKFVCQPALRPGGAVIRKGRRKINTTGGGDEDDYGTQSTKTYNKIRGKISDRTCPQCRRVFTSVAGMQYHRGTLLSFWMLSE